MKEKKTDFIRTLFEFFFWYFVITTILILVSGCAGARKTAQEPIHAESGGGITIWKIPIIGFGGWGSNGVSNVIIHKYDYTAKPAPTPPGIPPGPVDYPTIYGSAWDDPSLVIFKNESYRRIKVQIDKQKPITLEPYGATANLHLDRGEHNIRIAIEKPTAAHGVWEDVRPPFSIHISPSGRSQIFHIYE